MTEKLDLNTATVDQIDKIPMIGLERAQAIVDYRDAHGPFKSLQELKKVPSFSEKLTESMETYFEIADGSRRKSHKA